MPFTSSLLLLTLALSGQAQSPHLESWPDFLQALREKALHQTAALPDFVCRRRAVENVKMGASTTPYPVDEWIAEITYHDQKEHVRALKDGPPPVGVISGGEFGGTLAGLFDPETRAVFQLKGFENVRGRKAVRIQFEVPRETSNFTLSTGDRVVAPAYRGDCWADAETKQILRLSIQVPELPRDFHIQYASQLIEYGPVRIGEGTYWLPVTANSQAKIVSKAGDQSIDVHKTVFGYANYTMGWDRAFVMINVKFEGYRKFQAETRLVLE